jgi:hypothetical protein
MMSLPETDRVMLFCAIFDNLANPPARVWQTGMVEGEKREIVYIAL